MLKREFGVVIFVSCLILSSCAVKESAPPQTGVEGKDFGYYFRQGIDLLNHSDYAGAAEQFGKAIALNPKSARSYNLRGVAFFQLKNYRDAEEHFQKAVTLDPSYVEANNNLGSLYFSKRQYEKAQEMFLKTLSLSPDSVSALYSLGTLLLVQGKSEEGMSYLSRGIALDPEFLESHKAVVLQVSSSGPETPVIYFTYAKAFAARGDIDRTVEFLKKAETAGFRDWERIMTEKEFEAVRENPKIKEFIRSGV